MNNSTSTIEVDGKEMTMAEFEAADGLTVGGNLDLRGTSITALPENLSVGGNLDLEGTSITALPENLSVGGNLDLEGTSITALPENLSVGLSLFLDIYDVTYPSPSEMKIGCERHTLDEWEQFTDEDILAMDGKTALTFWKTWKTPLIKYGRARAGHDKG